MLLVSGCKGNHFFRNAKTFSGKICIRLQKSCKNDAPAPPPRLHTVATAPPDGRRHSGARRRPGATPPPGHATGPVSGCRKARLARQRRPFCKPPHTRAENSCGTTRCAAGGRTQQPPAASPPPAPPATGPRDAHGNTTRHPRAAPKWPRTRARNASFARKICQCCTFVVILCRKYNII